MTTNDLLYKMKYGLAPDGSGLHPPRLGAMSAGLCDGCRHQRVIRNTRGSAFSLCERSRTQPEYPKYPRVPVLECRGFEPRDRSAM